MSFWDIVRKKSLQAAGSAEARGLNNADDIARKLEQEVASSANPRETQAIADEFSKAGDVQVAEDFLKDNPSLAKGEPIGEALQPNFKMIGEPYQTPRPENLPIVRPEAKISVPEVISQVNEPQLPMKRPDIVDVTPVSSQSSEAFNRPKFSNSVLDWVKNNKLKAGGAAVGLGVLGLSQMGDKDNIPVPPVSKMSEAQAKAIPPKKEEKQEDPSDKASVDVSEAIKDAQAGLQKATKEIGSAKNYKDESTTLDFGQGGIYSDKNLQDVQKQRNDAILINQLGKAADVIGGAISGASPKAQQLFDSNIKQAGQVVEDYLQRVEKEKDDPNSPYSKGLKEYFKRFGVNVAGNASARDLEKIMPLAVKQFEAKENRLSQAENLRYKYAELEKISKLRKDEINANKEVKLAEKQDQLDEKNLIRMNEKMTEEAASSRSVFGKAANLIRSAEAIQQLAEQVPDLNQMDKRQITEIARSLDGMLSQGQATISGMKKLIPESALGDASKIEEYITGIPKGAQQKEFIERMMETVHREKLLAQNQILKAKDKIVAPYSEIAKRKPDLYKQILSKHGVPVEGALQESRSSQKTVVKKGYNKQSNKTQLIYSDGTKEIVDGKQ